jgi:putative transposase
MNVRSYHVKHRNSLTVLLNKAQIVADYAVKNKHKKFISTKKVRHIDLPSTIKCQILRKYGRGNIKEAKNVNLVIPNSSIRKYEMMDGTIKEYANIDYISEMVVIKPLKMSFRWNPGKDFEKINQVEISKDRFMISATFKDNIVKQEYIDSDILGLDLNCGMGRHIINAANLKTGEVINLGKCGPHIRKKYFMKRKNQTKKGQKVKGRKESRTMKDLDHKLSRKIVDYALDNKLSIVVEDLKGVRRKHQKGNGRRAANRFVNSWSFYRLQTFIEYKAKERGIPFIKIHPQYTSQECSYCSIIGERDHKYFICRNKNCEKRNVIRNADINAAFNVGKRSLQIGGKAGQK